MFRNEYVDNFNGGYFFVAVFELFFVRSNDAFKNNGKPCQIKPNRLNTIRTRRAVKKPNHRSASKNQKRFPYTICTKHLCEYDITVCDEHAIDNNKRNTVIIV